MGSLIHSHVDVWRMFVYPATGHKGPVPLFRFCSESKEVLSTVAKRSFYSSDKSSRYIGQVSTKQGDLALSYANGASSRAKQTSSQLNTTRITVFDS
jgi:hypothetical protein